MRISRSATALAVATMLSGGMALADPPGPDRATGYGMGPGMMGGHGPGRNAGTMHGWGMGPGMMDGYGPGWGAGDAMHGCGMGPGAMGVPAWRERWLDAVGLSDAQRRDVNRIRDAQRRKNWELAGKMQDEAAALRDLYAAEKPDRSSILAAYRRMSDLRLQAVENALDAREKIEGVLTAEQRKAWRRAEGRG